VMELLKKGFGYLLMSFGVSSSVKKPADRTRPGTAIAPKKGE